MTAAIWSTPPDKCALDFPAHTLVRLVLHWTCDTFGDPVIVYAGSVHVRSSPIADIR